MSRKKEALTLSVPPGTKDKLETLARRLGIFWGKSPSPSGLVVAIAQQELDVGQPFALNKNQVKALRQATNDLMDAGHVEEAQIILSLLLERGNLEAPLRQSLLEQVGQPTEAWRVRLNQLIEERQPFHLSYRNSQSQDLEFTVRHAQIDFYEKRFYLQIWCEETADVANEISDLPEFWHNRCLRLERIKAIFPISGNWRGGLDYIDVYLHLRGWLVNAYEAKPEDIENQIVGDVREVVRRVVNPFWMLREISRYWEDCEIVAPENMRQRLKQKVRSLGQQYDLDIRD
jgi:predicted DNA-binding transcriptional regulator YafY